MTTRTIAFEFIWDESPLLIAIAKELSSKGVHIVGVTLGNRWSNLLHDSGFELVSLSDYLQSHWDHVADLESEISSCQNTYGREHDLSFFLNIDRLVNDVNASKFSSPQDKKKLLLLHIRFWEKFFSDCAPECFYSTGITFMGLLTGFIVAKSKRIPFKGIYTTRDASSTVVFIDNYRDSWTDVNNIYESLHKRELSLEERTYAEGYLKKFREKSARPVYMQSKWQISSISLVFIREFFRRIQRQFLWGWGRSRFDYVTPPLARRVLKELLVIIKRKILLFLYFKPDVSTPESFAFFPLQLQPEETIDVHARYYSNQIATVENVAKSMPLTHSLVVKEHSVAVGKRKGLFSYYKNISKYFNIVLAYPYSDSHDYIRRADLIILASGTVGWEAILYGKPVIILGNAFYRDSGLVISANGVDELHDKIIFALENWKHDEERLLKFIVALRNGTFPGYFNVPHQDPAAITGQNIQNLTKAIYGTSSN